MDIRITRSEQGMDSLDKLKQDQFLKHRRSIDLGELPVHCELYPSKPEDPVILFIPGIGTYSEIYSEFLHKFSRCGFNLMSVDLRGHGYSGGSRGDYTVTQVIDDLRLVLEYIDNHFDGPVIVFGCSLGARLGLALTEADENQQIKALICHTLFLNESPPDLWHRIGWNWLSMNAMWLPQYKIDLRSFINVKAISKEKPMETYDIDDQQMVWEYPVRTLSSVYSRQTTILQQSLDIPAMIIVGSEDEVLRPDYIKSLIEISAQPFELIEIPNAGHMLPFRHIDASVEAVVDWITSRGLKPALAKARCAEPTPQAKPQGRLARLWKALSRPNTPSFFLRA